MARKSKNTQNIIIEKIDGRRNYNTIQDIKEYGGKRRRKTNNINLVKNPKNTKQNKKINKK